MKYIKYNFVSHFPSEGNEIHAWEMEAKGLYSVPAYSVLPLTEFTFLCLHFHFHIINIIIRVLHEWSVSSATRYCVCVCVCDKTC